jgi:hypothetical protein
MLAASFLHSFDESELHAMHEVYLRLCDRINVHAGEAGDALRIRIARAIVDLARSGIKPDQLEAQAMAKLGI